jgi:glycosyltransferase involved in cell wall biosynthesis
MKKIVFVVSTPMMARFFLIHHISLLSSSYEITIASNFRQNKSYLDILPSCVKLHHIDIQRKINIVADLKSLIQIILLYYKENFDLSYSISSKGGLLSAVASVLTCIPYRIHTFTGQIWYTKQGFIRYILFLIDKIISLLSTTILVDSQSQREFLISKNVVTKNKSLVLANGSISGVDLNRFKSNTKISEAIRKELGTKKSAVVFLFVGRLTNDKGLSELISAFSSLSVKTVGLELWIVGPDEDNIISNMGEEIASSVGKIRIISYTNNPEDYMKSADILCLPSYREGFGSVIIEAAACGIPAIGTNIYGIKDAIVDGQTGILIPVKNEEKLKVAMENLSSNIQLRISMGDAARKRAQNKFSQERITKEFSKLIEGMLC